MGGMVSQKVACNVRVPLSVYPYSRSTTPLAASRRRPPPAQIVVNLRTIDGSVKRRCEFRTSLSLSDVKHLMAERVYGPHARDLPPSRIRLAACAPNPGPARLSPQQAGSGATGSSWRRAHAASAGAGVGAGAGASAGALDKSAGRPQDGFEIDSVSSITPELVITVSVLPVPDTSGGAGRGRSSPPRTPGTHVGAPVTPPAPAKQSSVPTATPTTAVYVACACAAPSRAPAHSPSHMRAPSASQARRSAAARLRRGV